MDDDFDVDDLADEDFLLVEELANQQWAAESEKAPSSDDRTQPSESQKRDSRPAQQGRISAASWNTPSAVRCFPRL
jgi:hypothetical protein